MPLPEGTYLAWLDFSQTAIGNDPFAFFLNKAKVGLNDGRAFGNGGEGHVRLNFGAPQPVTGRCSPHDCGIGEKSKRIR